jgi:hypothetical protein
VKTCKNGQVSITEISEFDVDLKNLKFIRHKISDTSFPTHNILIFVEIGFRTEVFLNLLSMFELYYSKKKSDATACVNKNLYKIGSTGIQKAQQ